MTPVTSALGTKHTRELGQLSPLLLGRPDSAPEGVLVWPGENFDLPNAFSVWALDFILSRTPGHGEAICVRSSLTWRPPDFPYPSMEKVGLPER
ncbi:Cub And Sushi Domain-Containing Protein 3 [Manis pentadactyla]|nr:Cub And Sushi Domain-Containing Protein 3 [Manis pentadactyla]